MPTYLLSIEKVVAAMLVPANPQGSDRPDTKKSTKLPDALRKTYLNELPRLIGGRGF
jgi:hypothetical protein